MYKQVEKTKDNKNRTVANFVTQKNSNVKQGFGFVDNRPEAVAQRKLQNIENNGQNVLQKYQDINGGKLSGNQQLLLDVNKDLFAGDEKFSQAQGLGGEHRF